jgi:hypothetical protein
VLPGHVGAAHRPAQDELAAAGLLLGAQRAHGREDAPQPGEDGEGAQPPRHVAADGEQIVGHAVEQSHRPVLAEAALELQAVLTVGYAAR